MKEKNIYLLGYYSMKPRPGVRTHIKGWMDNPGNLQYDEKVEIVRDLKKNALNAKIVLNLSKKTVDRNGFNEDRDFKSLFKYFFGGYHKYMTEVMAQLDPAYMEEIVNELEAEMEARKAEIAEILTPTTSETVSSTPNPPTVTP
jgi:hypothetical protein